MKKTASFSYHAARLSWVCPIITLIAFALLLLGGQFIARRPTALIASAAIGLLVMGLGLALVALLGISKHGKQGILAPAIVGLVINGLLLALVGASVVASRVKPMQQHGDSIDAPAVQVGWSKTYKKTWPVSARNSNRNLPMYWATPRASVPMHRKFAAP